VHIRQGPPHLQVAREVAGGCLVFVTRSVKRGRGSLRRRGAVDVVRRSHGRPSGKYKRIFDHLILCSDVVDIHKITSAVPRQSSRA
jgi:hypothetical protein